MQVTTDMRRQWQEQMFAPIAARFVLVDTEGFWIKDRQRAAGRRPW